MGTRQRRNQDLTSAEFRINKLLTEHNAQFAIVVNTIEKGNEETHNSLRKLIEEVKQQSKVKLQINDKTINAIATNSKETGQLITETLRKAKQTPSNNEKHKNQTKKEKLNIETLWRNTINTRKQAFWQHHKAKRTYETFSNLLVMDPPRMPRKFLPKFIENENEEELEIRRQLAIEKFKSEINL